MVTLEPNLAFEPTQVAIPWKRDLWALVARLFAVEVDVATWRALAEGEALALELVTARSIDSCQLGEQREEQEIEDLRVEFCRLFIGPLPVCPPFASVHLGEAILGGRARKVFEEFLSREAIELSDFAGIASPDHIAMQFAAQAWLLGRATETEVEADNVQARRELLARHLLPWAPAFLRRLQAKTVLPFYRRLAELAQELLDEERGLHGL